MKGTNLLHLNVDTIKAALTEYLSTRIVPAPIVEDVDFTKHYDGAIIVKIKEQEPVL